MFQAPSASVPAIPEEMVITEVDINDVPLNCRDLLTKVKTQEEVSVKKKKRRNEKDGLFFYDLFNVLIFFPTNLQIRQFSGAVVSTKGLFMSETDRGKAGYVLSF